MYIQLREGEIEDTLEVNQHVFVDVDAAGEPLGIEILFSQRTLQQLDLASITVNIAAAPLTPVP
jgi:uncharacterized protein YuzE